MYKTIVVHVSPASGMPATFEAAARLAKLGDGHLIGTAVSGIVELNYLVAAGAPAGIVPSLDVDALRKEAQGRLDAFEQQCRQYDVHSFETRLMDTTAVEALLLQSRYCDLLVAGIQDVADYGLLAPARLPGHLVTRCARPVLLVPSGHAPAGPESGNIMIAWNGSAGASRALAFAMPLLKRAPKLYIAICNGDSEQVDLGAAPGADLATFLARHHRNVDVLNIDTVQDTGSALCELARQRKVELLVAGAYGHNRLHDWVIGSTTRSLVDQSTVPLLMTQ